MTRVAVLGTGIMGSAMARNLLRGGLAVTVWDRLPEATAGLAREGARAAGSAAEAVRDASVVITTLPTAAVVESVMFGDHVAEAFAPGAVWARSAWRRRRRPPRGSRRSVPTCCSSMPLCPAARGPPSRDSCSSWRPGRMPRRSRSASRRWPEVFALTAVRQVAEELTVRESMIFLDGREFTGEPPGLRTVQRGLG